MACARCAQTVYKTIEGITVGDIVSLKLTPHLTKLSARLYRVTQIASTGDVWGIMVRKNLTARLPLFVQMERTESYLGRQKSGIQENLEKL